MHCKGAKHKQKCVQRNELVTQSRQTLMTLKTFEEQNPDTQGQSLDDETKMLRLEFVKLLADCNLSAEKREFIKEFCHNHSKSNCNLDPKRTTSDYFHHVHTDIIETIKKFSKKHGLEYGVTVDASPYSFSAEAMSLRIVDEETWKVVEFLAGLNMYDESPDGEGTAASLLKFMERFNLDRSKWQYVMMDGCAVNTAAINLVASLCGNINVKRIRCLSHLLSLVGKKMESTLLKKLMKYLSYMKQSPKCRALFTTLFREALLGSGSIRWYADYEFIVQISKVGLDGILDFTRTCNNKGWAKKSSTKLLKMFENDGGDTVGDETKAKVIVAAHAIAWAGEIFCKSCYILEGNSNLIFSADAVLSKADDFSGINANDFYITNSAIDEGINQAINRMEASE